MTALPINGHHDVAIVGYGPVGATLAALLGRMGLRVIVLDKAIAIHDQPRAVGFDHDAMRIFQRIGIADELAPHVAPFRDAQYIGTDGRVIQRVVHTPPPFPLTWAPNYTCDQPGVESVLRGAIARMANVRVALGCEATRVSESGGGAVLEARGPDGGPLRLTAAYVVACDGASSPVRRMLGIALQSLDYDEPWIVVDMRVDEAALARLPATNVQYCEPERPCTHVVCPGNHRRWEFMLLDGEPREGTLSEERLWRLLARWLRPGEARIWRAAAYRFHALVASEWRRGRVLLAGDSAHQTPPFLGQGMCQGLRDAANLAWKLERVVRGRAAPSLLDTYAEERRPHVVATTRLAKELGQLISERDAGRARARDERLLAAGGGAARTVIRQAMIPGLEAGLIASAAPLAGRVFPQPRVEVDGGEGLFDELAADAFRLVVDGSFDAADGAALARLASAAGLAFLMVAGHDDPAATPAGARRVVELAPLIRGTLDAAGCRGVLVRPDHYIFGGFSTVAAAAELIEAVSRHDAAPPSPLQQHPRTADLRNAQAG